MSKIQERLSQKDKELMARDDQIKRLNGEIQGLQKKLKDDAVPISVVTSQFRNPPNFKQSQS